MRKLADKIFIAIIAVLVLALAFSGFTIYKKSKDISKVEKEMNQAEQTITQNEEKISGLQQELDGAKSENEKIKSELDTAKNEKDKLQKENDSLKKQIETLKAKKNNSAQNTLENSAQNGQTSTQNPVNPSSGKKVCYLTFDDGPTSRTPEILKILKKYNVKATFFVINTSNINYIKQAYDEGHAIGLHSYSHNYAGIYKNVSAYMKDLQSISDKVYSIIGVRSDIMRFPGGSSNLVSKKYCRGIMTQLTKEVSEKGYAYFDWNVDSDDAGSSHSSYTRIVNNVLKGSDGKNSICVLMHDAESKTSTVQALPKIIEGLAARGFRFELLTSKVTGFHHGVNN